MRSTEDSSILGWGLLSESKLGNLGEADEPEAEVWFQCNRLTASTSEFLAGPGGSIGDLTCQSLDTWAGRQVDAQPQERQALIPRGGNHGTNDDGSRPVHLAATL